MSKSPTRFAWGTLVQLSVVVILLATAGHYWAPPPVTNNSSYHASHYVVPSTPFTFPDGGRAIFPQYRLVALYGAPEAPVLGVLGRQGPAAAVERVKKLAKQYQQYTTEDVYPTFEIIATVASATPTTDNDYSSEVDPAVLAQWVQIAKANGVYVILDLQPGRTDFLTQARRLEPLLREPNVGLALDPEWRLTPTQVPLEQIGSVSATEVNATADWLAALVRRHKLPQKVFLLHQFRNDMLPGRSNLRTSYSELAYAIQMDGQGSQAQKRATWQAINRNVPPNVNMGWKNFYEKDTTLLSPKATMHILPKPWYVSYQ